MLPIFRYIVEYKNNTIFLDSNTPIHENEEIVIPEFGRLNVDVVVHRVNGCNEQRKVMDTVLICSHIFE